MADTENQKTDETKDEKPAAPPWATISTPNALGI